MNDSPTRRRPKYWPLWAAGGVALAAGAWALHFAGHRHWYTPLILGAGMLVFTQAITTRDRR